MPALREKVRNHHCGVTRAMLDLHVYSGKKMLAHVRWDFYQTRTVAKLHIDFCSFVGDAEDFVLSIGQSLANKFGQNVTVRASWSLAGTLIAVTIEVPLSRHGLARYRDALERRLAAYFGSDARVSSIYTPPFAR